jgi:hypothetical protein
MKNINKLLKDAEKARSKMESACGQIASNLQPFFDEEISVDFQPGDGFVVIWENESKHFAPHNIPVEDVVNKIKKDILAFKNNE